MKLRTLLTLFRKVRKSAYGKREIIIPYGSQAKELLFIRKGLVRVFCSNENGDEITFQLFADNQTFSNIHSFLFDEPSKFSYQALEDTTIFRLDVEHLLDMASNNVEVMDFSRTFFGRRAVKKAFQRVESFVFLSPEERYLKFVKDHPGIVDRAPDMYIANVLGMTPVSLSRIRRRIAEKQG